MLNKQKGNMYPWTNVTWNPLGGKCHHKCIYCYVHKGRMENLQKYHGEYFLDEKAMKDNLYRCKDMTPPFTVFVCSCNDLFADMVPWSFIIKILDKCNDYPENTYLFQTKNPKRLIEFSDFYPRNVIFGTTLETNRDKHYSKISKAVYPSLRIHHFDVFVNDIMPDCKKMISIEPIADFDHDPFVEKIKQIKPDFVSIGADSKHIPDYPEPSSIKVKQLIKALKQITEVKVKDNLRRIIR